MMNVFARRLAPKAFTVQPALAANRLLAPRRTFITAPPTVPKEEALGKLAALNAEVISANWADYLYLVYNVPFWEAEYEKLSIAVLPYLSEPDVGAQYADTQE